MSQGGDFGAATDRLHWQAAPGLTRPIKEPGPPMATPPPGGNVRSSIYPRAYQFTARSVTLGQVFCDEPQKSRRGTRAADMANFVMGDEHCGKILPAKSHVGRIDRVHV